MRIVEIRRHPVKSMLGEVLPSALVGPRGLSGDRLWAVRGADGKFGSGKSTRRFRRMEGLFAFRAHTLVSASEVSAPEVSVLDVSASVVSAPVIEFPDGRRFSADDPVGHHALSAALGHTVTLTPEATIPHHDEGPVSIITTAGLRALTELGGTEPDGSPVAATRFRANLLVDTSSLPGSAFTEDDWVGRALHVGPEVVLRVVRPLTRCAMIDMAQETVSARNDLLKLLAAHHDMTFGVFATVERPGRLTLHDDCVVR